MDAEQHAEQVRLARQTLLEELGLETTDLGRRYVAHAVTPRTRVRSVRSAFGTFMVQELASVVPGFVVGPFMEPSDEVSVQVPVALSLSNGLHLPVQALLAIKLPQLAYDLTSQSTETVAQSLIARVTPAATTAARRLEDQPPNFAHWVDVEQSDIDRAFRGDRVPLNDRKELFARLRVACAQAGDRTTLERLARSNPGFLDYLQCFPLARGMKRRVVAWLGPTNSGKTYRCMQSMKDAASGMYLGPLRLLALEQRDRLEEMGRACSLITGEERQLTSSTHSARTVEMTDFSQRFAVCVLDEMQLAFDRDRGWAWVAAFCGAAADTLYVTGPSSCEAVIRHLAELCGDEVEVHHLQRQGLLNYEGVLDWRRLPPRSAVIGFSRAMVLELKAMFEAKGRSVAVLYGGLSPEVRREEARRFRSGEADIVCATDAIGLGLNLPIDRVIFYEVDKFDGERNRALSHAELLQIAGRAGRGPGSVGWVAALSDRDGRRIEEAMQQPQTTPPPDRLPAAPTAMHVRAIADHLNLERLTPILEFFRTRLTFPGGTFFPDVQDDVVAAATLVDTFAPSLPIEQRHTLACVPIDIEDHLFRATYCEWLEALEAGQEARFPRRVDLRGGLEALEEALKLITAYRWLALKFPQAFTDGAHVEQMRREATESTQTILRRNWAQQGLTRRECRQCRRALLPSSPHPICRVCAGR